jgi:hypothetical protein
MTARAWELARMEGYISSGVRGGGGEMFPDCLPPFRFVAGLAMRAGTSEVSLSFRVVRSSWSTALERTTMPSRWRRKGCPRRVLRRRFRWL